MEFVSLGWQNQMGIGGAGFLPSDLANLELWTKFNSGITVTGAGVSQWDDVSGNGNHLKQGADTNMPSEEVDGSILFDGVDNFLKADAFTLVQPETVYILLKQMSWASLDYIYDGNSAASMTLIQHTSTPKIAAYAGLFSSDSGDLALGSHGSVVAVFNGASSVLQIDNNTPITGDFGSNDGGGFTLGCNGNTTVNYSNLLVQEVIVYSAAHDAATRAQVIAYLGGVLTANWQTGFGTGDSFADDVTDWPAKLNETSPYIDKITSVGYPGDQLTGVIGSSFDGNLDVIADGGFAVVQGGVNDIRSELHTPQEILDAVIAMRVQAIAHKKNFALINIAPFGNWVGSQPWSASMQTDLEAYNALALAWTTANNIPYADIYTALGDVTNTDELAAAYDSGDGLHPNATGSQEIADVLITAIDAV